MNKVVTNVVIAFGVLSVSVLLLALVGVSSVAGFDKSFDKKPENFPDALILLPNAKEVIYGHLHGTLVLAYAIETKYPAAGSIAMISNKLKESNWTPLKEDFLNPGLSSSHVRGWTSFMDATKEPPQWVHQWLADWENQTGDVIRYAFRYHSESETSDDLTRLTVTTVFMPAFLAKQAREDVKEESIQKNSVDKTK